MNRLIIDGFGLLYKSFYAYKSLITSSGIASGGLYGFLTGIRSVKVRYPDYAVHIAWDLASTRKKQLYADYKANRDASSRPDMGDTIKDLKEIFSNTPVTQSEMICEEADDVIASMIRTYYKEDGVILVYSADKDLLQLVKDGKVIVVRPKSGKHLEKVFDEERVKSDYGVYPRDIACLLTFLGDTIDNIPGVGRVPSKIIANLCEKYHTVDGIYDALPSEVLTDFQRKSFEVFSNQAKVNHDLVQLRYDLNYVSKVGVSDVGNVSKILCKYEIKSLNPSLFVDCFYPKASIIKKSTSFESYSLFESGVL